MGIFQRKSYFCGSGFDFEEKKTNFVDCIISVPLKLGRVKILIKQPRNKGTKLLFDIIGISLIEQFSERCLVRK